MPVDIDVAGKPQRGAFAIRVIRNKPVIRREANEQRCKLRIIRQLKFEISVRRGSIDASSTGIMRGVVPNVPAIAVRRSSVNVPITPPVVVIFVESMSDERVVITRLRDIGISTAPKLVIVWPHA